MEEKRPYRRLYREKKGRLITGLCQGIGEYFAIDPVIVRLVALLLLVSPVGFGTLLLYFIFSIVVPSRPRPNG